MLTDGRGFDSRFMGLQVWGPVSRFLASYYESRGLPVTIPNWRPYVDGDGNGTVAHYEP